jgi:dynein intermediate chain 3, axonemal
MKYFPKYICDAEWSPSRPAVFFIAKSDGSIDVWDLLDRTHAPILTQSISAHQLTFISCRSISPKQQLIAIGDSLGTLNIMEVPWSLRRTVSGELQAVKAYFLRETERQSYVKARWDFRERERDEMQKQAALRAGVGPAHIPTEEEITIRLRNEYNDYLQFEATILRELGLRSDDDQPTLITA